MEDSRYFKKKRETEEQHEAQELHTERNLLVVEASLSYLPTT